MSRSELLVVVSSTSSDLIRTVIKVNSNSNHCLFGVLPSSSSRVQKTRAAAAAHPLEFEVSRCRTSPFARSFQQAQVRMWSDHPYSVLDTGMLDGFQGEVNMFSRLLS